MGSAGHGLGPPRAGAVPGPHGMQRSPGRAVGRWAAPARGAPCERRWSLALARGWRGGGGAPAHAGQGQGPAALAVSCCSRGAQRRHLRGLGHGARGEVREAAWCQRMALAGGSDRPLLSEGGLGVLPLLALGRRSLGFGAEGRRLQLAFCAHPGSGDPGVHTLWPGSPGPAPGPTPRPFGRTTCKVSSVGAEGGAVLLGVPPLHGTVASATSQHRRGPLTGGVWGAGKAAP